MDHPVVPEFMRSAVVFPYGGWSDGEPWGNSLNYCARGTKRPGDGHRGFPALRLETSHAAALVQHHAVLASNGVRGEFW